MNDRDTRLVASPSQTVGPFFHVGPGGTNRLGRMATIDTPGESLTLRIRVFDGEQVPVSDALIELLQADAAGGYSSSSAREGAPAPAFSGFGRLGTDDQGWCRFETVRPGAVETGRERQAAHINVCVHARGLLRHLYTRIYFDGDPALATDPLLSIVPSDRRPSLLARRSNDGSTWEFVIHLQGEHETVFFDV